MKQLEAYLQQYGKDVNPVMAAYVAQLENVASVLPSAASSVVKELKDQRTHLKLIASENYCSPAVQAAMGNLLTDKYSEGFAYHRFYAGCENVDAIESQAVHIACNLFGAEHAYVQPHSGADANLCAYWAVLNEVVQNPILEKLGETNLNHLSREQWNEIRKQTGNQRILGLDYYSGGHLTHGYRQNVSAQMFDAYSYSVDEKTGLLDYEEIRRQADEIKPLILLAGYSAYPRKVNFRKMREIADGCGAVLMCDMAHFAGLVAGKVFEGDFDPVKWCDIVTTTTHKTLRGPRGGMILCKQRFASSVDKGCPLVIGGPLPHVMVAKAVALKEASEPEFAVYAHRIVENSQALAQACVDNGIPVATGGTENHLMLLDVRKFGLNGRQAESALRECGITLNRNALPFDPNGPWYTSGLRLGTAAVTTLGMGPEQMKEIASVISLVLNSTKPAKITKGENAGTFSKSKAITDEKTIKQATETVLNLLKKFVLYPELDLDFLEKSFCL